MAMNDHYRLEIQILNEYSKGGGSAEQYELLFKRTEASLEINEVQNEFIEDAQVSPIHFKKLVYFKEQTDIPCTATDKWRILRLIMKTRGLSRWLSFNFFSLNIKELEKSYLLSRITLFRVLFNNRDIIENHLEKHIRYLDELDDLHDIQTVTHNDYFRAISGVKMELPTLSILSTQGDFQPNIKSKVKQKLRVERRHPDLIPRLMNHNAKAFLNLLLEYKISEGLSLYLKRNYPDARSYIDSHVVLKAVRMTRADLTFDEIARELEFELTGDVIQDVDIWHQRFLVKGDTLFEFDAAGSHRLPFVAGHRQYTLASEVDREKVLIQKPVVFENDIDEAIFLSNRADENWFHLLLDTLPRYLFLRNLSPKIPVLIREDLPVTTKEFLYKVLNRTIIELPSNSRIKVGKLHLLAARSTCFDTVNDEVVAQVKFSPAILRLLVHWIKSSLDDSPTFEVPTTAYFRRSSRQRRVINFQKIEQEGTSKGLTIIEDDEALYRNQVKIFSQLQLAVIPGGAMLANMIFMRPGTAILCLRSFRQNDLELWRKLADAVGLNYFEVVGLASYYGRNALQRDHSNYYIFPLKFRRILSVVMQSIT